MALNSTLSLQLEVDEKGGEAKGRGTRTLRDFPLALAILSL